VRHFSDIFQEISFWVFGSEDFGTILGPLL
jgi:hypothetical protein